MCNPSFEPRCAAIGSAWQSVELFLEWDQSIQVAAAPAAPLFNGPLITGMPARRFACHLRRGGWENVAGIAWPDWFPLDFHSKRAEYFSSDGPIMRRLRLKSKIDAQHRSSFAVKFHRPVSALAVFAGFDYISFGWDYCPKFRLAAAIPSTLGAPINVIVHHPTHSVKDQVT